MKTTIRPQLFNMFSPWIAALVCSLVFLFASGHPVAATPGYLANAGTTFLNVYFTDGSSSSAYSPSVSPYSPPETINTIGSGTPGVGTALTVAGEAWLQGGSGPYPGAVSANWPSSPPWTATEGNATANVSYQQSSYYDNTNLIPSSGVSPVGTSVSLVNSGGLIAELRLDWTTTYTYSGPPVWTASTTYTVGSEITDANNNLEVCTTAGTSGSGPTWPPPLTLAGTTPPISDGGVGGVTWTLENTYVPDILLITMSGTVGSFSAVAGQESFSVNGAPAQTATIPLGGDFISSVPSSLVAGVDSSIVGDLFGFKNPPTTSFFSGTAGVVGSSPQLIYNGNSLTVNGYLDVFVDPGSIQVQIAAPVTLGITTSNSQPVVLFPASVGTNYVLQMSTNLATGKWVTVTNGIPFSGGIGITNAPSPAFFRML